MRTIEDIADTRVVTGHRHDALDALFHPKAIAIVGASGRADNPFARPLEFLIRHGFEGEVFPVNPRYDSLQGVPCYPDLDSLPAPVDLVLLLVSAGEIIEKLPAIAAAGATAAVVFASGFGEIGPEGQALQDEMVAEARRCGVRLLGPNCQGVLSVRNKMAATFTAAVESALPQRGGVAYVGQSGAVGGSILSLAGERGIGMSAWASTGNQADLSALEIAAHLIEDTEVLVLSAYLESTVDGEEFERVARRAAETSKPFVILQSGLSQAGARAAASHTGAIVGSNAEFLAMCAEFGVRIAEDIEDLVTTIQALSLLPKSGGSRVGIVTTSGGAGSLAADQLEAVGLAVEPLGAHTQERLREIVPSFGSVANPVDVTAQLFRSGMSNDFVNVCRLVIDDPDVDSLMIVLTMVTGGMAVTMAKDLEEIWTASKKPVVVVWLAARAQTLEARALIAQKGWPVTDSPRLGARTLAALTSQTADQRFQRCEARPLGGLEDALEAATSSIVTEAAATEFLKIAGVRQPLLSVVVSGQDARNLTEVFPGKVALKVQSVEVLHKTDRGGVRLGVDIAEVPVAVDAMMAQFRDVADAKVMVQEMIPDGIDLLVGITRAGQGFPPLITVGMGGVTTEIYRDAVSCLAPIDSATAKKMLLSLRGAPLLTGFRGATAVDLNPVAEAISSLSHLGAGLGARLEELEVNPLRVCGDGEDVIALDFLLQLTPQSI